MAWRHAPRRQEMDLGLIGLPQCGKSTLLALLSGGAAKGEVAVAPVPDERLDQLTELFHPRKTVFATMQLRELAGLAPGRLERGQRSAFFEGVRRSDALLHVVRAFSAPSVPPPLGDVNPARDARVLEEELLLADMERAESLAERLEKNRRRSGEEDLQLAALRRCASFLEDARPLRLANLEPEEVQLLSGFGLLTLRGELLALNVDEDDLRREDPYPELTEWSRANGISLVVFSAQVEAEIAALESRERQEFLAAYGLRESGTDRLAKAAYETLGLISFLTAGEDEVRAWPVARGTVARRAAGKIHSDIEKGFIRAEVAPWSALIAARGWKTLREQGLARLEGKDYIMRDGDVVEFRFNV